MLPSLFPFPAAIRRGLHRRTRAPRRHFGGIAIVFAVFSLALSGEGVYNMLVSLSPAGDPSHGEDANASFPRDPARSVRPADSSRPPGKKGCSHDSIQIGTG